MAGRGLDWMLFRYDVAWEGSVEVKACAWHDIAVFRWGCCFGFRSNRQRERLTQSLTRGLRRNCWDLLGPGRENGLEKLGCSVSSSNSEGRRPYQESIGTTKVNPEDDLRTCMVPVKKDVWWSDLRTVGTKLSFCTLRDESLR